ncbi:MAG: MbcA/ParS/Xre antitoxin family protein [Tepidisphaeraceae bacterium]|jgi:uncharacterized protein (DUF2384 family)
MVRRPTKKVARKRRRASADEISRTPEYQAFLAEIVKRIRTVKGRTAHHSVRPRVTMRELKLARALRGVMEPEALVKWLDKPNPAFDGQRPIELIKRGETRRLWQMVYELRSGMPV